jgi:phage FluMu protein Com
MMEALDGNAAAGALSEVFAFEMTAARGRCDGCGKVAFVAEARAYVDAPGMVLRCASCDNPLLVLTRADGRYVLGLSGLTWLELRA